MFLSSKSLRKLRKLRRRAGLAGLVLASGCLYWGGRLAWAHSVPQFHPLPQSLPSCVTYANKGFENWLPSLPQAAAVDPLVDPAIHQQEEACNQSGLYPQSGQEFQVQGPGWSYSSLDGVQRSAVVARGEAQPKDLGWDGQTPVWGLVSAQGLNSWLPSGLQFSREVRAVEGRLWPAQHRGQLVVHLSRELPLTGQDDSLEKAWKHLPSAPLMGCLRKSVAAAVFRAQTGLASRLLNPSEGWVAASLNSDLGESDLHSIWRRVQNGWLPMALWGDFRVSDVATAREVGLASDADGTLYTLGMAAAAGTATRPWEGWQAPGSLKDWVGAGRFHWRGAEALHRVEWVAQMAPAQVVITFNWSDPGPAAEEPEVATLGPDLETLYTPHPNVIAGR